MLFKYNLNQCNVKNCDKEVEDLLLCKVHHEEYIIDEKSKEIQTNITNWAKGDRNIKLRLIFIKYHLLHYIFFLKVYYMEHYPLESIFLYHYKILKNKLSREIKVKSVNKKICKKLNYLINDFNTDDNSLKNEAESIYLNSCIENPQLQKQSLNIESLSTKKHIEELTIFTPKRYILWIMFFLLFFSIIQFFTDIDITKIKIFDTFGYQDFFYIYILVGTLNYFGLQLISSIEKITIKALDNSLYVGDIDNINYLLITKRIKADLKKFEEFTWSIQGAFFANFMFVIYSGFSFSNLYLDNIILSMNIVLILLAYPIYLTPFIYASFSTQILNIKENNFYTDIFHPAGESGIKNLIDFITYGLLYNGFYLVSLWVFIPIIFYDIIYISKSNTLVYVVIISLLALPRIRAFRKYLKIKRGLKESINIEKDKERKKIDNKILDLSIRKEKYEHLLKLSSFPLINFQTKNTVKNIFIIFMLPIIFLLISIYWKEILNFLNNY